MDEAGAEKARQLDGPLTALLLYMRRIRQPSHPLSRAGGSRVYLQQVVENRRQTNATMLRASGVSNTLRLLGSRAGSGVLLDHPRSRSRVMTVEGVRKT